MNDSDKLKALKQSIAKEKAKERYKRYNQSEKGKVRLNKYVLKIKSSNTGVNNE